ncbi:MAG: hypothetical protein U0835_00325 [Isosphaeraceae bacterium]
MTPLIEQLAAEYARIHPGRDKPAEQFSDEIRALCSLLDRILALYFELRLKVPALRGEDLARVIGRDMLQPEAPPS